MNNVTQFVTKTVISLFIVLLPIFTYFVPDIYMIIYDDIVVTSRHMVNKNNKIITLFWGKSMS